MRGRVVFVGSALIGAACSSTMATPDAGNPTPDATTADASEASAPDAGGGDASVDATTVDVVDAAALGCDGSYPFGPYGTNPGDVITNLSWTGKTDTNANGIVSDDAFNTLCLATYFQNPNIQVVVLIGSAVWCVPCNQEVPDLVTLYQSYQTAGGHVAFLEVLLDGTNVGTAPTTNQFQNWVVKYKQPYDVAVGDQPHVLDNYNSQQAYPLHVVIQTSTMKIFSESVGNDVVGLQNDIDTALGKPPQDAGTD
jgi:hypothetical protein